ncbi:acetolactate synthase small subunit [Rhodocytophaga rosea]|jgi:acetolactate synthase I/III small subunit|uniref:Acetolactate synthase small subunit n=1 Tax=Rhodocytophaga rosea TaxID=2704465 RepID=A0A6C0GUJ2_9BACT|nr:acetolactate synthase small subunit [Rhodocytophaga rosea]QHT71022.1 acetolactate synthase small subunit [Rhodocytophaga rosea]
MENQNGYSTDVKLFIISVLTENKSGLLNAITIIFTRRKINIESINVSESEVSGVSRYTIVVKITREKAEKLVKQIRKLIEVLGAFLYEEEDTHFQELALYKVPLEPFLNDSNNRIEKLIRDNFARILVIEREYIIIEKTGRKSETTKLFEELKQFGVSEFVRSGRISISKSKRRTETFLKELEELSASSMRKN